MLTMLSSMVTAIVYSPISQLSDIQNGDKVVVAMQNGRSKSAWYAVRATNNQSWNAHSISVRNNIIRTVSEDIIWDIRLENGVYYLTNTASGTTHTLLSNSNGWSISPIVSNRFAFSRASETRDTLIWRSSWQGVYFDLMDRQNGDSIYFDQVAEKRNLTTGAYAINIFKQSPKWYA